MLRNILIALAATGAIGLGMTTMTATAEAAWCNHHRCYNNHHNNSNFSLRIGVYPGYYGYSPGCGYRTTTVSKWNGHRHVLIKTRKWLCY